jgi:hypothetical protein
MKRPEQEMQKQVFAHLRARSNAGAFYFHVPNGVNSSARIGGIMKAAGVVSGVPDICVIHRGTPHFLELKAGNNRPTIQQKHVMDMLLLAGSRVAVAGSLDEALYTLEFWGILKRNGAIMPITRSQTTEDQSQGSIT